MNKKIMGHSIEISDWLVSQYNKTGIIPNKEDYILFINPGYLPSATTIPTVIGNLEIRRNKYVRHGNIVLTKKHNKVKYIINGVEKEI